MMAACALFAGCTVNPNVERDMMTAPTNLSDAYTQVHLRLKLAVARELDQPCDRSGCMESAQFDERVTRIGANLAATAYQQYPDLARRVPAFDFSVMDKSEPGTGSTAGGVIVVLRPVTAIAQTDEALSFVLAREIGHVVAQHHEENTATSLMVSLLAAVIAPVAQVVKMLATVYSGATTIAASASVTAASFASSKALIASYRPRQLDEADRIALKLLASSGLETTNLALGFAQAALQSEGDQWIADLRRSVDALRAPARSAAVPTGPSL